MLKKNLTSVFALALVALAVPAFAQAGTASGADIANDHLLYSVQPADAQMEGDFDASAAFGDLYDESILSSQRGVEGARDASRSQRGQVDYAMDGNWAITCDNYL